jgi:hypothetical protein
MEESIVRAQLFLRRVCVLAMPLASGEPRKVKREFMLNARLVGAARALDWIVMYSDELGFAQQLLVRGEALPGTSTNGAAKANN